MSRYSGHRHQRADPFPVTSHPASPSTADGRRRTLATDAAGTYGTAAESSAPPSTAAGRRRESQRRTTAGTVETPDLGDRVSRIPSAVVRHPCTVRTVTARRVADLKKFFKPFPSDFKSAVYYLDDQPFKFKSSPFGAGLRRFLRTHDFLINKRSRWYDRIDYAYYARDPRRLSDFAPAFVAVVRPRGKHAKLLRIAEAEKPVLPPMYVAKDRVDGRWLWIQSIAPTQQCPTCGRAWVKDHSCNERRSAFFYHVVQRTGREMWQHVHFSCPAQIPHVKHLFVTYDIETYTVFERKGKRMHPFMLCFMLSGDPDVVRAAETLAAEDEELRTLDEGYYWLNVEPGYVARRFRAFRTKLQIHFSRDLVQRYATANAEFFQQALLEGRHRSAQDVPYETIAESKLVLPEDFYSVDIVVLGHNICKFDELLLATELVERRDIFPPAGKVERSFMPRVGRLLFNDVLFRMPNPNFLKNDPSRVERWARGLVTARDSRSVFVRFMVRDTLQLTSGAKLAKAAAAYALEMDKGQCPYEAVNELMSRGSFEADSDGFPVERYWEDPSVIPEQKQLWRDKHADHPYDLVEACLEYCMQDVRVTQKLAHTLYVNYDRYFKEELGMEGSYNIFVRPTIPSNTHAFWKQLTFSSYVKERIAREKKRKPASAPVPVTGRRKRADRRLHPEYLAEVYAPHRPMFKYIRQALRGGRCYPNVLGPYSHPVYVFDICGMYASALTHPMPHGIPLDPRFTAAHVEELNRMLSDPTPLSYFDPRIKPSILKIEAYPPPPEQLDTLPPLCSRRGGRLVWTNEAMYDEVVTVLDILTLHNRGWRVNVLHDDMNVVFPEWKTICAEYVGKNIAAKEKADREKNEVMRSISKMLSNALYGAFATNMDTTRVVFEQDMTDSDRKEIYEGTRIVKHVTLLNDPSFTGRTILPDPEPNPPLNSPWSASSSPSRDDDESDTESDDEDVSKSQNALTERNLLERVDEELEAALARGPFIYGPGDHAHRARAAETRFKPLHFLDAPAEALTVLHLENLDKLVDNKRYATQIACFVLGWSRAFFSEWCQILHDPDRGIHPHDRAPQTLYGDTDSLFVTESGYRRMVTRGKHRIKGPHTRLTFDSENPALYWACECDIKCKRCGSDTYSSESVFLAPKLYGLKDAVCTNPDCGHVGTGKIRSKGHRQAELVFDTLMRCWDRYEDQMYGGKSAIPELHTRRTIFKTTLLNKVSRYDPFTIHNEQLIRVLRPWVDRTLYQHGKFLFPYDTQHPNPRTADHVRPVPVVGHEDPLAPFTS
ncbi:DNA polymerase [Duck adenovirus 4]|uniref:DNA polymerase n=1 Tax=Duck adenovirus 4 TaxID=2726020 RepID=A0A6M3QD88_9ADEN|nr:DNA polymerase [Duck adenovirus 4]